MLTAYLIADDNLCQTLKHILSPNYPHKSIDIGIYCLRITLIKVSISAFIVAGDNLCFMATLCAENTGMNFHRRQYVYGRQYMSPHGVRRRESCVNIFLSRTTKAIFTSLVCSIYRAKRQEIVNCMSPPPLRT